MSEELLKPKTLTCQDCGEDFTFEIGEQQFFKDKGFPDPIRCPQCRAKKKKKYASND